MLFFCAVAFELTDHPFRYRRRLPHIQNAFSYFVSFHCQGDLTLPEETRTPVLETILKEAERTITLYAATVMPNHAHILFSIRPLQPEAGAVPHFANDQAHFSVEGEQAGWARGRAVAAGVVRSHAAHEQR